jgi:hypothetical protein
MSNLILAAVSITLVAVAGYVFYRGKVRIITLLPYQRGVLFLRGVPLRDVGPGTHRVRVGSEFLVFLDMRPISFQMANQPVTLQDGATAVYGISASAEVTDVRKAIYSARDYNHVPAYQVRRSARRVLSSKSSSTLTAGSIGVAAAIAEDIRPRLAAAGFALASFHLSQLAVTPPQESASVRGGLESPVREQRPN